MRVQGLEQAEQLDDIDHRTAGIGQRKRAAIGLDRLLGGQQQLQTGGIDLADGGQVQMQSTRMQQGRLQQRLELGRATNGHLALQGKGQRRG